MKQTLLYFTADWCAPCRRLKPRVNKFADENADRYDLKFIDVEACPEIAQEHGVNSIPAVIAFDSDIEVKRMIGVPAIGSFIYA